MIRHHQISINEYNVRQRVYFERKIKPTMVPRNPRYVRNQITRLLSFAEVSKKDRILEVGCGMGRYTLPLAERRLQIEGLDFSRVLLERLMCYNKSRYNIPLHCADIMKPLPHLENRFDAVIGFFTLHHLKGLEVAFSMIKSLLKPGGRAAFLEPNPFNPLYYIQILITPGMNWEGDGGIVNMQPKIVFSAMQKAGFTGCITECFGFFPPFIANTQWGARLECIMEGFHIWHKLLPFQLFRAERPIN